MPTKKKPELTSSQKKILNAASASLDRAYAAARKKVGAARIDSDDTTFCLVSPHGHCRGFKPPRRGFSCARPGCGHRFSRHNVF